MFRLWEPFILFVCFLSLHLTEYYYYFFLNVLVLQIFHDDTPTSKLTSAERRAHSIRRPPLYFNPLGGLVAGKVNRSLI